MHGLVAEEHFVLPCDLRAERGDYFAVHLHDTRLDERVGLTTRADARVGQEAVQTDRLVRVAQLLLILDLLWDEGCSGLFRLLLFHHHLLLRWERSRGSRFTLAIRLTRVMGAIRSLAIAFAWGKTTTLRTFATLRIGRVMPATIRVGTLRHIGLALHAFRRLLVSVGTVVRRRVGGVQILVFFVGRAIRPVGDAIIPCRPTVLDARTALRGRGGRGRRRPALAV